MFRLSELVSLPTSLLGLILMFDGIVSGSYLGTNDACNRLIVPPDPRISRSPREN